MRKSNKQNVQRKRKGHNSGAAQHNNSETRNSQWSSNREERSPCGSADRLKAQSHITDKEQKKYKEQKHSC